jgi:hypothetical protein
MCEPRRVMCYRADEGRQYRPATEDRLLPPAGCSCRQVDREHRRRTAAECHLQLGKADKVHPLARKIT